MALGFARLATAYVQVEARMASTFKREVARESGRAGDQGGTAFSRSFGDSAEQGSRQVADGFGKKLTGAIAGLGIGAAVGTIVAQGFGDALERGAVSDRLAAQLDLTGPQSAKAGRVAGSLFTGAYGENIGQVNEALKGIQENIGDLGSFSERRLEGMGAKALDLANIMDEDVGRVTRAVGQLMRNDLAPNAEAAFDILTRGQQEGANATGDLIDTIEEYSTDLSSLGLTGPQAIGALSGALQAGARNSDLAADALRELSIRAVDGSKLTAEGFQLAGLDAERMADRIAAGGPTAAKATSEIIRAVTSIKDPVKREAAGVALFGTRFEELGPKAIGAMDPMAAELDKVGGAADRMGKKLNDNAKTKMTAWNRAAREHLVNFIGGTLIPQLEDLGTEIEDDLGPAWRDFTRTIERGAPRISAAVRQHLGVQVPDTLNAGRTDWRRYRREIRETRDRGTESFADLWRLITSKQLTAGEKFGLLWHDVWNNTRQEKRDTERLMNLGSSAFYLEQGRKVGRWIRGHLGDLGRWGRDSRIEWGVTFGRKTRRAAEAWADITRGAGRFFAEWGRNTRVQLFVLRLMWSNAFTAIRTRAGNFGDDIVGWFRRLPGRIASAFSLKAIKDKFASIFKGFTIPIKLAFGLGGDGLGILGSLTSGGRGVMGATGAVVGAYRALGSPGSVVSGLRVGARTLSGAQSYHALGRALDITPIRAIAVAINRIFGSRTKELITPWRDLDLHHGRPHYYSSAVHAQHSGSNAHIHWAMQHGAYFRRPTVLPGNVLYAERGEELTSPVRVMADTFRKVLQEGTNGGGARQLVGTLVVNALGSLPQHIVDAIERELAVADLMDGVV